MNVHIDDRTVKMLEFLSRIGQKEVSYDVHVPAKGSISYHVKKQLDEKIKKSNGENKDMFFLSALLDRRTDDKKVQLFRKHHQHFKQELIQCWHEAPHEVEKAVKDIRISLSHKCAFVEPIRTKSSSFDRLYKDIPPIGKEQLLICLKIIDEKFNRQCSSHITDITYDYEAEKNLRKYLLELYGVKYKLANWAISNVTGHWFVIDGRIIKVLEENRSVASINICKKISRDDTDEIFKMWFGTFDEKNKRYSKLCSSQFKSAFPDFTPADYQYLPFIVTQYLWFYWEKKPKRRMACTSKQ